MTLTQRQRWSVIIIGIVLGSIFTPYGLAAAGSFLSTGSNFTDHVHYNAAQGPNVYLEGNLTINASDVAPTPHKLDFRTNYGNITLSSQGNANATIPRARINGTWTNTSQLDVTQHALTITPEDKNTITLSGGVNTFDWHKMTIGDNKLDFAYSGTHGDPTTVTIYNLTTTGRIAAYDTNTSQLLGGGKITNHQVTLTLPNSQHTVKLVQSKGAPVLSNPTPKGAQNDFPSTLGINVSSPNTGDNVTVNFTVDGSLVATKYATSDGRKLATITPVGPGSHNVTVNATNEFGESTITTWSYSSPSNLTVRDELTNKLLKNATATAIFYSDSGVIKRTTTNGTIPLKGLPVNTEYTVEASATNYTSNTIVIQSLSAQHSIYLHNSSLAEVTDRFAINDKTGNYPDDTSYLVIQRPLNISGNLEWKTVSAGKFGADGYFQATLLKNNRTRIIVKNNKGDSRILGSYTPTISESVTFTIGTLIWDAPKGDGYAFNATVMGKKNNKQIKIQYWDPERNTTKLCVNVHERGNASNVLYPESCNIGTYGKYTLYVPINNQTSESWNVTLTGTRGGESIRQSRFIGGAPINLPFDTRWLGTLGLVMITFIGSLYGGRLAIYSGEAMVMVAGLLMIFQWLYINPILFVVAAVIAIGGHLRYTQAGVGY